MCQMIDEEEGRMGKPKKKISFICGMHYIKLFYRSVLFLWAVGMFIWGKLTQSGSLIDSVLRDKYWLMGVTWVVYAIEMTSRFFPSPAESMGCQKQFKRNYQPTGEEVPRLQSWKRTFAVVLSWVGLNGLIGLLYYVGVIEKDVLILVSLAYGVCDMICILFFCPFQTWMMKNRCCTVCRIYNWDFAMMFTPFIFVPHIYTWSLLGLSLVLLFRWELTVRLHPERFAENTNACVSCANCKEKLCHHKKQLIGFWRRNKIKIQAKIKAIIKPDDSENTKQ